MAENKLRLMQLADMYSFITGTAREDALEIIRETETGKRIEAGDPVLMYEQHTSNLADIAKELPCDVQGQFTAEKIIESLGHAGTWEAPIKVSASPEQKEAFRRQLKQAQKNKLKISRDARRLTRSWGKNTGAH